MGLYGSSCPANVSRPPRASPRPVKLASASPSAPAPAASGSGGLKLTFKLGKSANNAGQPAVAVSQAPPTPAPEAYHAHSATSTSGLAYAADPRPVQPALYGTPQGHTNRPGQAYAYASQADEADEDDEDRVPATKYRKLKKLYLAAVQSRDDASLSLFRSQRLVSRLRDDKSALLDRVIELEMAAGVTSFDAEALREQTLKSERETAFPLLHPPILPSLDDRQPIPPTLTTNTDMTGDDYNKPAGPAPLPKTFPPRQRSHPLRTAIAAQKLRDEHTSQQVAHALPPPSFPAVHVLGLAGSAVAHNVERALAGESFDAAASASTETAARGSKRRRESSAGAATSNARSRGGRSSMPADSAAPGFNNLPNPFALAGAVPVGTPMSRNNADAIASAAPAVSGMPAVTEIGQSAGAGDIDVVMDDGASVGSGDGIGEEDGGDFKPTVSAQGRRSGGGRKSDVANPKPKKLRQHGLTSGTFAIPPIPRNADGSPVLPIAAGIMVVRNLGTVDLRDGFHTERYIFPIGYEAVRRYPSMIDPATNAEYICRIVDGGNMMPRFELHPSDQPGQIVSSGTPTGAWSQVVRATNEIRKRNHSGSVSGPDYYGLSHNIVKALIQELPGADQVPGYIWQTFVEDASGERRPANAPKKPMGARRKSRAQDVEESPGYDADDYAGQQTYYAGHVEPGGEYASPADFTGGDLAVTPANYAAQHDYTPASLQNLLAAAAPPSNPYDLPTGVSSDAMFSLNGAAAAPYDPYAIPVSAAYDAGAAFAYNLPPGGQPMEYPSSDEESA